MLVPMLVPPRLGPLRALLLALLMVLTLGLGTALAVEEARVRAWRARTDSVALAASNAEAQRDSTHDVALENARVSRLVGDSLRIVEKRVVQVAQRRDALDAALQRERKARYALLVRVDSLSISREAPVGLADDARRTAVFHVREEPYTVDADVSLAGPPEAGNLHLRIDLDDIAVRVRVTCLASGNGPLQAAVTVETPRWARVTVGDVSQDAQVCAERTAKRTESARRQLRPVLGIGRVLAPAGVSAWGMFIGVGLSL